MRARDSQFDEPIIKITPPPGTPQWLRAEKVHSETKVQARAPAPGPAWEEVFHHRGWDTGTLKKWRAKRQQLSHLTGVPPERDIVEQLSDDFLKQIRGEPFYPSYRAERLYEAATIYIVKPPGSSKSHLVGSIHGYYVQGETAVRDLFSMVKILHQGSQVWLADFKKMKLDRMLTLWELLMCGAPEKAADGMRFLYSDMIGYVTIGKKQLWPVSEAQWAEGQMAGPELGGPLHVPGLYESREKLSAHDYPDLEQALLGSQSKLDATHATGKVGPGMLVYSPTSHGYFVHRLERGGGSLHWFKAPAVGELPRDARMIHEVLRGGVLVDPDVAPISMRRAAEPGKMQAMAKETFKDARARLLGGLASHNWAIKPHLKVPQAISPEGAMHLYFRKQAIYQVDKDGNAEHSLTSDMRGVSVEDLITMARRHHGLFEEAPREEPLAASERWVVQHERLYGYNKGMIFSTYVEASSKDEAKRKAMSKYRPEDERFVSIRRQHTGETAEEDRRDPKVVKVVVGYDDHFKEWEATAYDSRGRAVNVIRGEYEERVRASARKHWPGVEIHSHDVYEEPAREEAPRPALEARENPTADPAIPWVKVERNPEQYAEAMKLAASVGPIDDARGVYDLLASSLAKEDQEVFLVVLLDVRSQLRGVAEVHRGGRSHVGVDVQDVLRVVITSGAESFIGVHNHPTGKASPSRADGELTEAIDKAAKEVGVTMRDHVVVGKGQYFSFAKDKLYKVNS